MESPIIEELNIVIKFIVLPVTLGVLVIILLGLIRYYFPTL
jgi:hypothetical protein